MAYGRLRLMDTDYERTARQRKVISLAFEKAKKADWATLNNVIQTLLVTEQDVDTSIDLDDIVKMARGITKLHMGESYGFPEDRKEGRVGSKGDCVIPNTLESNVVKLHSFLFGDENYEPSSQVKNISNKIASDCGAGGKKETPKATKAPETEALSTEDLNSTEATGSHGETSPSHEYWYPWESETDDGARDRERLQDLTRLEAVRIREKRIQAENQGRPGSSVREAGHRRLRRARAVLDPARHRCLRRAAQASSFTLREGEPERSSEAGNRAAECAGNVWRPERFPEYSRPDRAWRGRP
mgnify:CR=1 FL=1